MPNWANTLEFIQAKKYLFLNEFDRQVKEISEKKEVSQRKNEFISLLDYLIEVRNGADHFTFSSQELPPEPSELRIWLKIILSVIRFQWENNEILDKDQENMAQRLTEAVYLYAWKRQEVMLKRSFRHQEQKLMAGIVAAQENERKRLARDIHDEVIQLLASSILRLQVVQHSGTGRANHSLSYNQNDDTSQNEDCEHSGDKSQSLKDLYYEIREIEHLIREAVQAYRLVSVDVV